MPQRIKHFNFSYPLKRKAVKNLKVVDEYIGDLKIICTATFNNSISLLDTENKRLSVDIDFVRWEGIDIKPVLEVVSEFLLEEIEQEAASEASFLFTYPRVVHIPKTA